MRSVSTIVFDDPFQKGMFVKHKLTRLAAISVTTAALMAGGMLSSAASADTASTSTVSVSASPATAQETYIYAIYARIRTCSDHGKLLLVNKLIDSFECKWDSPGWALWITV
jgi:hypothetical protein